MNDIAITWFEAGCIGATAIVVLWNQILLGPQAVNYPTISFIPRTLLFLFGASLAVRSVDIFSGILDHQPERFQFSALPATLFLFLSQAAILYGTLRQWLPARVWRRIRQLIALAACGKGRGFSAARKQSSQAVRQGVHVDMTKASVGQSALVELRLQGVRVVGPNEGPSALAD
jgi:hypothetical protein